MMDDIEVAVAALREIRAVVGRRLTLPVHERDAQIDRIARGALALLPEPIHCAECNIEGGPQCPPWHRARTPPAV